MRNLRETIRERIDLVELVSGYVQLERAGRNFKGLCPFHTERTPSFYVSPSLNRFHCFGCGASGDAFAFLMRIEGISFREALRRLAAQAGVDLRTESPVYPEEPDEHDRLRRALFAAQFYYRHCLQRAPRARQYLQQRGLTPATIERFQLGYAPDGWDYLLRFLQKHQIAPEDALRAGLIRQGEQGYHDYLRHRIVFPIHDPSGRVIAFGGRTLGDEDPKYLNTPETPLFEKRQTLYGWHLARSAIVRQRSAIVVEGYMDLIMLHQYGFEHAVATLGTAFTEQHAARLQRLVERVYLLYDSDSAGIRAALRAAEVLEAAGIPAFIVELPPGEDPDSLLRRAGAEALQQALEAARPAAFFGLEQLIREHTTQASVDRAELLDLSARTRLLQDALRFVAQLRSPTEQTACLERLAPLSPAYLISPQAAMEALQRDVRRLQRERRRAAAQRAARQTDTPEQEAPASAHGQDVQAATLSVQLPRAVIEAERTVLRAVLLPETAMPALEQLPQIEWSLPEHRALAQTLYQLPQPPYRYAERDLLNAIPDESLQNLLTGLLLQTEPPLSPTTVAECLTYLHRRKERARRLQILNELTRSDQPPNPEKWQEYWRLRAES
ncbi:MAG: DNA primase [Armatimonadota bacterium]